MASNGSSSTANGVSGHLSHRPQTPAYTIGNQFVNQFYHVLVTQPEYLHRFYTDDSSLTHSDSGTDTDQPSSVTVSSQKDIRQRVIEMGFKDARTEIWSVDSQYSAQQGVLVLVTGSIYLQGKKKRDFVENFFLAPQEKGYYVLNDQLRYVSDRAPSAGKDVYGNQHNAALQASMYHQPQPAAVPPYYQNAQPAQYATPYQSSTASSHTSQNPPVPIRSTTVTPPAGSQYSPQKQAPAAPAPAEQPVPEQKPAEAPKPVEAAPSAPKPVAPPAAKAEEPKPVQAAPEPEKKVEEAEKKAAPAAVATKSTQTPAEESKPAPAEQQKPAEPSAPLTYADRLRMNAQKAAPASRPATSQPRPAHFASPARPTTAPQVPPSTNGVKAPEPTADDPSSGAENSDANTTHASTSAVKDEDLAASIFVRNLPEDTTPEKLLEALSQFGAIKGGLKGISLKAKGRGAEFAFIDFEETSSVQAAKAAKVEIDGKTISVVERRPQLSRGYAPRGGRGEGRGGFRGRNDGRGGRGVSRENRPHTTGGRSEARPEGGRGRGYEGRGLDGGRGRGGDRGRGRYNGAAGGRNGSSQPAPTQPTAA